MINAAEGDTLLTLKQLTPVRLLKNDFFARVREAELRGAGKEELAALLGLGRAKKGMFEGDLQEGELEIGQVSGMIRELMPAAKVVDEIYGEFRATVKRLQQEAG